MGGHESGSQEVRKSQSHGGMERRRLGCAAVGTIQARLGHTCRRDVWAAGRGGHVVKMEIGASARLLEAGRTGCADRLRRGSEPMAVAPSCREMIVSFVHSGTGRFIAKGWLGWSEGLCRDEPAGGTGLEAWPPAGKAAGRRAHAPAVWSGPGIVSASERGGGVQLARLGRRNSFKRLAHSQFRFVSSRDEDEDQSQTTPFFVGLTGMLAVASLPRPRPLIQLGGHRPRRAAIAHHGLSPDAR